MEYVSTRDVTRRVNAAEAIVTGLSPEGGLFVPAEFGQIDVTTLRGKGYGEIGYQVLQQFLFDYTQNFLQETVSSSYSTNFNGKAGQLKRIDDRLYSLELWHGPTAAFKDYALQLMPKLLVEARRMLAVQGRTLVLVATSGDTGKAALEGFKNLPGIAIASFYPQHGTSEIQRLQMVTQTGNNVAVYAVKGNFDDAQRGVKAAFTNQELADTLAKRGDRLSSANSINWGRLVPQLIYYFTSYLKVCADGAAKMGDPVDFCVPTGNFGDIMAGYYAKKMGLPVGRLICASNRNNVLTDFFETGHYDARRDFYKTSSPSMDILVSSNLERLLYHASCSDEAVRGWMDQLAKTGEYQVDEATLRAIRDSFTAGWADENAVEEEISRMYRQYHYLCDPHTAVAFHVQRRMAYENRPMVVLSTASPFKFSGKVLAALGRPVPEDEFEGIARLEEYTNTAAPETLTSLKSLPVRFDEAVDVQQIPLVPLQM